MLNLEVGHVAGAIESQRLEPVELSRQRRRLVGGADAVAVEQHPITVEDRLVPYLRGRDAVRSLVGDGEAEVEPAVGQQPHVAAVNRDFGVARQVLEREAGIDVVRQAGEGDGLHHSVAVRVSHRSTAVLHRAALHLQRNLGRDVAEGDVGPVGRRARRVNPFEVDSQRMVAARLHRELDRAVAPLRGIVGVADSRQAAAEAVIQVFARNGGAARCGRVGRQPGGLVVNREVVVACRQRQPGVAGNPELELPEPGLLAGAGTHREPYLAGALTHSDAEYCLRDGAQDATDGHQLASQREHHVVQEVSHQVTKVLYRWQGVVVEERE